MCCGHATIAAGVVLCNESGAGIYLLQTPVGEVPVSVRTEDGISAASLTSVNTRFENAQPTLIADALDALGWLESDLDSTIPVVKAYVGAWHLVLAVTGLSRLSDLNYDFERLKSVMIRENITTLQLVWRESEELYHSRNPFPVGGVVEDPATGAAAAALGGYLRDSGIIAAPATIRIRQGEAMGRPSLINVNIPLTGGIVVSGAAEKIS